MANPGEPVGSPYGYTASNQDRYNQIMQGYRTLQSEYLHQGAGVISGYQKMLSDYAGVGESQRIALGQQYERQRGQAQQSLVSRGLGGSTVLDSANRGINYDESLANINLSDTQAMGRANIQGQFQNYLAGHQQGYAGLVNNQLNFQGQAFGQKYGTEAQYGFNSLLQAQGAAQNQQLAQLNTSNQANLSQLQFQQQMQQQQNQNRFADYMQNTYGYY